MDSPDVIKLFIDAGVAVLLGTGLVFVWKAWRASELKKEEALAAQAADFHVIIEQKNKVIETLATQIEHVTESANTRLDRMIQMIADGGVATQQVLADNAAAMAVNQQVLQAMKDEVKSLRDDIARLTRGGL